MDTCAGESWGRYGVCSRSFGTKHFVILLASLGSFHFSQDTRGGGALNSIWPKVDTGGLLRTSV